MSDEQVLAAFVDRANRGIVLIDGINHGGREANFTPKQPNENLAT